MSDIDTFATLLNKDFPWKDFDLEAMTGFAVGVAAVGDRKQEILGKIALEAYKRNGYGGVKHLAHQMEVPFNTLHAHFLVMKNLDGLEVPEELSWSLKKAIAFSGTPKETLAMVIKEGLNRMDLLAKLGKLDKKQKHITCPNCKSEVDTHLRCLTCNTELD